MNLLIDLTTKVIAFGQLQTGASPETVKQGQSEPLTVQFLRNGVVEAMADTAVKVGIKTNKGSSQLIATATLTASGDNKTFTGDLNLDTENAALLEEGAAAFIAVQWTNDSVKQESDDARLTISKLLWRDDDSVPIDGTAGLRAAFFAAYFTSDDNSVTFTVDDVTGKIDLAAAGGGGGGGSWGSITGTLTNQTDLQTALNAKANSSHTHTTSEVTGLDTALAGKAASSHTHVQSSITGLVTALAAKANLSGGKLAASEVPTACAVYLGYFANFAAIVGSARGTVGDFATTSTGLYFILANDGSVGEDWQPMASADDLNEVSARVTALETLLGNITGLRVQSSNLAVTSGGVETYVPMNEALV